MEKPPPRWLEPLAAALAWVLLLWLSARPPCLEGSSCAATLGARWCGIGAALAAVWLAPGWMLWRMLRLPRTTVAWEAAFACGAGLSWLVLLGAALLAAGLNLGHFVPLVVAANAVLTAAFVVWRASGAGDSANGDERPPSPGRWPLALAAAAFAALLAVALGSRGFTYGSDEWFYLRAVRQYLDGKGWIYDFEVWELVIALVVRLAGASLLDAYRVLLPAYLIAFAAVAYAALAQAVLRDGRAAAFAFVLQAVYCLSDMHTRGTGAGMALLARVIEDKYAALLLVVPLVQAAALRFMAGGPSRLLIALAALLVAGELVHPLAAVWIAVSLAVPALAWAWERRTRMGWRGPAMAGALALAVLAMGVWLRSIRPASLYDLTAPSNARVMGTLRRQVVILSLEKGWYMGDARLLAHPLMLAALLGAAWLAWRARGSRERAFLVGATALPVALVFIPPLAVWAGAWISPWILPRLLWAMPVTLVLAALLQDRLAAAQRPAAPAPSTVAWTIAVAVTAVLLAPRMARGVAALHQRNRIHISPGELELARFVASDRRMNGYLLAPPGVGIRLPAWSSRVRPLPGPDVLRGAGVPEEVAADCVRLLKTRRVGDDEVALLDKHSIAYVAARNGSPLGRKLARLRPAFPRLFEGSVFTVYEWRREGWPEAVAARRAKAVLGPDHGVEDGVDPRHELLVGESAQLPGHLARARQRLRDAGGDVLRVPRVDEHHVP